MEWAELDEALGLSQPESSPQPSPLSDHSYGFHFEAPNVPEREGSPVRRRRPSKKRRSGGASLQQQQQQQHRSQPALLHTSPPCTSPQQADGSTPPLCATPAATPAAPPSAAAAPAPAAGSPSAPPADGACALQALPLQLLLRLLSFLSAQDLTAAAQASPLLRSLSDEPVLWRRLFCARWGKPRAPQRLLAKSWKARYEERDLAELAEARARTPPPGMQRDAGGGGDAASNMFVEAQLAKRQRALGKAHVDDVMEVRCCCDGWL